MHEMQTIVTDVRGDCLSVCHVAQLCVVIRAAFAKSLWPLVSHLERDANKRRVESKVKVKISGGMFPSSQK